MFAWFMRIHSRSFYLFGITLLTAFILAGSQGLPGCANIAPPMGGPRDSLPPILLETSPADSTTGFAEKNIMLSFDEYVQLDKGFEEVLVNPPLKRFPTIEGKLRTVSIAIKDTLKPNTTYSIDFGKAIKDVNEGNPLKGFTYVFSTGNYIDSLTLSGTVVSAETGKPDSTLIVILHTSNDDSAVAKEKPAYVTRLDSSGRFTFRYLPADTFRVFALKDEGFKQYQNPETPFAFADQPVITGQNPAPVSMRFFTLPDTSEPAKKPIAPKGKPGGKKADPDEEAPKTLVYAVSAKGRAQDILKPLEISFPEPYATLDTIGIRLTDTLFKPVAVGNFILDSSKVSLPVNWQGSAFYTLVLDKGFATDSAGLTTNTSDTIRVATRSESEYGAVSLTMNGIDFNRKPLLFFIQNNTVVKKTPLQGNKLRVPLIEPGQYTLRIVYDENGNGEWDTGNYWEKKQPEFVLPFPKEISVRANWDNEFQFEL